MTGRMAFVGFDDLMPVLVVVGAVVGVGLFNLLANARPGRRGRSTRRKTTDGPSSA